jgi:DNA invertase Pin-like site-specific DNA recombinase
MKAIYTRVSSEGQNSERQLVNIKEGVKVYSDVCSGSVGFKDRPQGKKLIKDCEAGNIKEIEVSSIDRLGRNLYDIIGQLDWFAENGIQVNIKKECLTLLDGNGKKSAVSQLMIGLLSSVAQFERSRIRERQSEGIAVAKKKGRYLGRSIGSAESKEVFLSKHHKVEKYLKEGESLKRTALLAEVSVPTVIKVKKFLADNS